MKNISWFVIGAGLAIRAGLVFYIEPMLDCDEAPQAYMAQLVSWEQLLPLVHFQLPYIGALEIYPLAVLMLILGDNTFTVNFFYFALSAASLHLARLVYERIFSEGWACLALCIYALSHPLVLWMSLQAYSFGGLVFFEAFILWLLVRSIDRELYQVDLAILGLLNGLSLYNNVLSAGILFLSVLWVWSGRGTRKWIFFLCCVIGYLPMLMFNITNDFLSYQVIVAKFLGVSRQMVDELGIWGAVFEGFVNKLTGKGPPAGFYVLYDFPRFFSDSIGRLIQSIGAIAIGLVCFLGCFYRIKAMLRDGREWGERVRDWNLLFYFSIFLLFIPGLAQVRYMTSLLLFLPILFCNGLIGLSQPRRRLVPIVTAATLIYLTVAHISVFAEGAPVDRNDEYAAIVDFLLEQDLRYGYGGYCFQSHAAFVSRGQIKISPQIGPIYLDKIPSFSQEVDRQEDVFYILPKDIRYMKVLEGLNVTYKSKEFKRWIVIWEISRRLSPEEIIPKVELARADGFYRWSYRENPAVLNPYRGGH